jgi:DNA repair protein RadC
MEMDDKQTSSTQQTADSKENAYRTTLPITAWAEDDRPREKLLAKGKNALTDAELIAILIGSGNRQESAVDLCKRILKDYGNNLNELGKATIHELMKYKGIGEAKAITIAAALEFGRRKQLSSIREKPQIRSSIDAYNAIAPMLMDLPHEEFWILLLNRSNHIIGRVNISVGGTAGTVVDAKIIFRKAIEMQASGLVLCHNHPSGSLQPSQADISVTRNLKEGGRFLDISILDHIIVSERGYCSLADEGLF